MPVPLADLVLEQLPHMSDLYHRLLILAAPSGSGKTAALQVVSQRLGVPLVNVNLELSRLMLQLATRQRALQVSSLLEELVAKTSASTVLLDNTEILFEVTLQQDPLRLLQGLSRNRTVAASWNGTVVDGNLVYATSDHAEHRHYPARDLLVVSPQAPAAV